MAAGTLLNSSVGAYRLVDFLGAGGMGEVYRAVHVSLGRVVALKVLTSVATDAVSLQRFRNEARVHAGLHHPHIATLFDFLDTGGRPCIVMEYVDGETLDDRIRRDAGLSPREALCQFEPIVDAVDYLHRRGITHRDIKASNVKISAAGVVKLLDFGIAKASFTPTLTRIGGVIGTVHYLAPEQLANGGGDARSDIWALGVLLYEMVTGRLPFDGPGLGTVTERILRGVFIPASSANPASTAEIDAIIANCLRRNPAQRYPSAAALLSDVRARMTAPVQAPDTQVGRMARAAIGALRDATAGPSRGTRPDWSLVAATAVFLAAVGFVLWLLVMPGPVPTSGRDPVLPSSSTEPSGPAPSSTDPPKAPLVGPRLHTVRISVRNGPALLYREGRFLNGTPFELREAIGERVQLTLQRAGYLPLEVEFVVTTDRDEYEFELEPLPTRSSNRDPGGAALMLFALPFWWRRSPRRGRRNGTRDGGADVTSTMELVSDPTRGGLAPIVDFAVLSDPGCMRDVNEDTIRIVPPRGSGEDERRGHLAIVADGMGGHLAGEIASRLAVECIEEIWTGDAADPPEVLARAVREANTRIHQAAKRDATLAGMGTTCTALALRGGLAYCAHVGDSRLYLIRDGELLQMTEDHSAVMDLVRRGQLTRDEARHHPDRNVLLRALGNRGEVDVSTWPRPFAIRPGDRFVLCSDGLHDLVEPEELLEWVQASEPASACEGLIALARQRGAPDNISVAVLIVRTQESEPGTALLANRAVKETRVPEEGTP